MTSLRIAIPALIAVTAPVTAGTFSLVELSARLDPADQDYVQALAVVHPPGFNGSGGVLPVRICVQAGETNRSLVGPLQAAIAKWNSLEATTSNCQGCYVWEEPEPVGFEVVEVTLLHELGHCALGLGHVELSELDDTPACYSNGTCRTGTCDLDSDGCCYEATSFTASINAMEVVSSSGTPRGDGEDQQSNGCPISGFTDTDLDLAGVCVPCPVPAECCPFPLPAVPIQVGHVSWFRRSDNDPFVVDAAEVDLDTFSRSTGNLPAGHEYAANGNRLVGEALGYTNAQSVMYGLGSPGQEFSSLGADDVNMVRYGMSGTDRQAGTGDDYSVQLLYQFDCTGADIRVAYDPNMSASTLGACLGDLALSFPQPGPVKLHYTKVPVSPLSFQPLTINGNISWDLGSHVFSASFEGGDFREWETVVP